MTDNVPWTAGTGTDIATDDVSGVHFQKVKLVDGTADSPTVIAAGGGVEAAALRVTLASDSTGVVSVDDNGAALTVDNGGTFAVQADTELTTADLDTGAGTDTRAVVGLVGAKSGGGALIPGDATAGLKVDLGSDNDVTLAAGVQNIGDVDVLTVPAPLSVVGTGTEATAMRVTVATDSTGVLSVDDNAASLTVDQGTAANLKTEPAGNVAHDAGDSGNPIKVGAMAVNALPTAVANLDRANNLSDLFGRQLIAHIDPAMQAWKSANYTTQQTGATIWDPTAGKKIAITSVVVGSYGTTAGRLILWFGANGDTTYSAGTDQLLLAASYAPSTTSKPGTVFPPAFPVFCVTADMELHITTDAALSVDVAVVGYEW